MNDLPRAPGGFRSTTFRDIIRCLDEVRQRPATGIQTTQGPHGVFQSSKTQIYDNSIDLGEIRLAGNTSITVKQTYCERNGSKIMMGVDSGKDYKTITGLDVAATKYYVYTELSHAANTYDPNLVPDTLTAKASATEPAEGFGKGLYYLLGTVYCAATGVLELPIQEYQGKIPDDFIAVPDSNSGYDDVAPGRRYFSVEYSPRIERHYRTVQLRGFDAPDVAKPDKTDLIPYRHYNLLAPGDYFYELKWDTPKNIIDVGLQDTPISSDTGEGIATDFNTNHRIEHHNLDSATGIGSHDFTDAGGGTNDDHDKRYEANYLIASYLDDGSYRTTGYHWMSSLHISADGGTDSQYWTAAKFLLNLSDDVNITAVNDFAMTIGAASTWEVNGNVTFRPKTDTTGNFSLGVSTIRWGNIYLYADALAQITAEHNIQFLPNTGGSVSVDFGTAGSPINAITVNGTNSIDQSTGGGTPSDIVVTKGIVTGLSLVAHAVDGTYANPTSITISHGIITAIS